MLPRHHTAFWTRLVDGLARADAAFCVTNILWRRSKGGRSWVRPQMLQQDLCNRVHLANNQSNGKTALDFGFSHWPHLGWAAEEMRHAMLVKMEEALGKKV